MLKHWTTRLETGPSACFTGPDARPVWSDGDGLFLTQSGSGATANYQLRFREDAVALVCPGTRTLSLHALSPQTTKDTLEHLLHDQLHPRLLAHEGRLVVHAGAVQIDHHLALFLGESGMGKSTLAGSFYQAGTPLLSDDCLVIDATPDGFAGQPIHRGLRLLPDSLARLFPRTAGTRPMAHYSDKRHLPLAAAEPASRATVPIGALFFLAPASGEGLQMRRMSAAETCMGIISNSFSLDPTDSRLARSKLQQAAALANAVPAFALAYPRDYASLPQVQARIRAQMAACASVSLPGPEIP